MYLGILQDSFLAFFHFFLVSVLSSRPSLTEMKFYNNFSLVNNSAVVVAGADAGCCKGEGGHNNNYKIIY